MNCPKCGQTNKNDAKFCGSCGYSLSSATQQSNANNQEEEILDVESEQQILTNQQTQTTTINQANSQPVMTNTNEQPIESVQPVLNVSGNNLPNGNQNNPSKSNKRPLIILIISIAVIVAAVVGLVVLNLPSKEKTEKAKIDAMFNPEQLIKVKSKDKYGYINTDGEFVIKANYEAASDFTGNYAIVRTEVEEEGLKKSVYQIIDKKGKIKKQAEDEIKYIADVQLWIIDGALYNESMKQLSPVDVTVEYKESGYFKWENQKENTAGIMNEKGKQTYTYKFQEGESYFNIELSEIDESLTERYCRINIENDKYEIVNCATGVVVQEFTTNYVSVEDNNIFQIKNHDTWDFIEVMYIQNDRKVYQSNSSEIYLNYYPGYVQIRDNSKPFSERYTYLHTATEKIETSRPESTSSTTTEDNEKLNEWEKLTANKKFSCSTGYGLMNNDQITLPCEWDNLEYLELNLYKYLKSAGKNYIYGEKDDKWYLIDLSTKKAIIEFNASYITQKTGTTFMYYTDKDTNNKKVYNLYSGQTLNIDFNKSLSVYSNYITVKDAEDKTLKYYNTDLKLIYTENL